MSSPQPTPPTLPEPDPADLVCPSCGYCVYGSTDNRCPECGQPFDWALVQAAARTPRALLFEFAWRPRPAAALARTWYLAVFRPAKLWGEYGAIARPPVVAPLLLLMVLQMLLFVQGWPAVGFVLDAAMNALGEYLTQGNLSFTYDARYSQDDLLFMGLWYVLTFAMLQVFFQTKRRLSVRWPAFLRVQVHAFMAAATAPAAWCLAEGAIDLSLFFRGPRLFVNPDWYEDLKRAVFVIALIVTWFLLGLGLRRHLGFSHAYVVAGTALLCGHLLASLVVLTALS